MNVSSVGLSSSTLQTQAVQRTPESTEVQKVGPDHDGDADDGSSNAAKPPAAPTVNMNGQKIGQLFHVVA